MSPDYPGAGDARQPLPPPPYRGAPARSGRGLWLMLAVVLGACSCLFFGFVALVGAAGSAGAAGSTALIEQTVSGESLDSKIALIEVNAGMYLVHEGSEITLQGQGYELTPTPGRFDDPRGRRSTYSSLTLRILRIDEREVRIELSRLNETITIR